MNGPHPMDGILGGRITAAAAVIVAIALLLTGVRAAGSDEQQINDTTLSLPETIVLDPADQTLLDGLPDDGLNRFIVAASFPATVDSAIDADTPVGTSTDVPFTPELREGDRYTAEGGLSEEDRALLQQVQGLGTAGAPQPDALANAGLSAVEGIHAVTPVGEGFTAVTTSLTATEVAELPGVESVEIDDHRRLTADYYSYQWALNNTEVPGADIRWEDARTRASGRGVVVAVIDSGVSLSHPDLAGQWWTNPGETCGNGVDDDGNGRVDDCTGWDFANNDNTVDDGNADNRHGTHVSGTIAADDDGDLLVGVAPGARIMPLKIFHNGASSSSRLAAAINYAVDNGADVINLSLGGDNGTAAELSALRRADAAGVAVVVAAGNEGRDTDRIPSYPAAYDLPVIIAVGASDSQDRPASYSNRGAQSVDLFAPGSDILSAVPNGLAYMSGTSMATPHATGAAALVIQNGQRGAAVRHTLMDAAKPIAGLEGMSVTGARLDAAAALGVPRGGDGVPEVTFASFNDLVHLQQDEAVVRVTAEVDQGAAEEIHLRGTLGTVYRDQGVYGILDQAVIVGDATVTTDDLAQFPLSGQSGLSDQQVTDMRSGLDLPVGLTLPAGDYALAVELLDSTGAALDPAVPPAIVFFSVAPTPASAAPPAGGEPSPGDGSGAPDGPRLDVPAQPAPGSGTPEGGSGSDGPPPTTGTAPGITIVPPGGTPDDTSGSPGTPGSGGTVNPPSSDSPVAGTPDGQTPDGQTPDDQAPDSPEPGTPSVDVPSGQAPPPAAPAPPPSAGTPGGTPANPPSDPVSPPATGGSGNGDPAAGDALISGSVSPDRGGPDQGIVSVTVPSGIPQDAYIRFGGSNAPIMSRLGSTRVLVQPPTHSPGVVDVTILSADGTRRIRSAYTFLNADGQVPAPPPAAPEGPAPSDPTPANPAPGNPTPSNPTPSNPAPSNPAPADPAPSNPSPADPSLTDPGAGSAGSPELTGPFTHNGLQIDRLPADSPLAGISSARPRQQACLTDVCAARSR